MNWYCVKIKFHSNDNIEWPCVQIELNSNISIEFDLTIELWFKFNWRKIEMQIGGEGMKLYSWVQCFPKKKKKNFKRHKFIKNIFMSLYLGMG